jgi:5-methyltetrahydrofolate--homocysteine methyltransferase
MTNDSFLKHLKQQVLVSDGATGTNLQKRGLSKGLPSESWVFDNPEAIIQLHRDFIAAGSNIILTDTFGGSPIRLAKSGLLGRVVELNQTAVGLARKAAQGTSTWVAGSIGPTGELLQPNGQLEETEMRAAFVEQARALSEAGVDLLVVETQFDLAEARIAVEAVRSVTNLPLVCSFSFDRGTRTMMGVKPSQLAEELEPLGVDLLGINCGRSLPDNLKALQELRAATRLPIWFKPNAGMPHTNESGESGYEITPEEMGALAAQWIENGAAVVGGCCGTTPEHLHQIAVNAGKLNGA